MMRLAALRILLIFTLLPAVACLAAGGSPLDWYREAKFGMFIHWGPYSQASVEASWPIMVPNEKLWGPITESQYVALARTFNPSQFDAAAIVRLARAAGQRYIVFTTKHHDGFCMFDSSYTSYKITNTPYRKDIVAQLAEACKRENMPLGFYYSPPDMHHPGYRDTSKPARENWHGEPTRPEWPLYLDYMELQVRELLTRYGPVAILWFDGLDHQEKYDGYRFLKVIHELSPRTLVNNRIGVPGDYETPEQFVPDHIPVKEGAPAAAPGGVPRPEDFRPWETCMTINNTWAYNSRDRQFKSATTLIRTLVEVASKGGNLLLNVGPTPEGTIQPEFRERLEAIGHWMKTNGEAIYGSTFGPWQNLPFGRTTAKGTTIYLHVFDWPATGELKIDHASERVKSAWLLEGRRPVVFRQTGEQVTLDVPKTAPDESVSVIAIETRR
ncbi:MAG TPA: alpha-L-fucosidase [Bryobacteraceae bacterium]|nr:alpha-L-fucosidase [Bryobacteraceae bacterium]